jgi:hypothetical protein
VPDDFATAFIVVAAISALSAFVFLRLPGTAGASLSRPARGLAAQEEISQA